MTVKIEAVRWHIGGIELDRSFLIKSHAGHSACRVVDTRFLDEIVFGVVEVCANEGDGHRQVHVAIATNPHDLDVFTDFGMGGLDHRPVEMAFHRTA